MIKRDLKETIKKYNELKDNPPSNIFRQKWDWINNQIQDYSSNYYKAKPNKEILQFIANFIWFNNAVEHIFSNHYCYHFACMLKGVFPELKIVWHRNYGHILAMDKNGYLYDAHGLYGDRGLNYGDFPDIEILGFLISDFTHSGIKLKKSDYTDDEWHFKTWCKINFPKKSFIWCISKAYKELWGTEYLSYGMNLYEQVPDLVIHVWKMDKDYIKDLIQK